MKQTEQGSYTVEAAFIVPLTLGIAFTILYLIFFWHDRVILQSNVKNAVFLSVEGELTQEDYSDSISQYLWCVKLTDGTLTEGLLNHKGSAEAKAVWDIPLLAPFMQQKQTDAAEVSYGAKQPEQIIRYKGDTEKKEE